MEQGLDVEKESEVLYVAPRDAPEAGERALALLSEGDVAAVILSNLVLHRIEERAPALADHLRILAESPPTSIGVVAVHPDMPPDQISVLRAALLELDPDFLRTEMPFGRLIALDEPLADHMADALHRLGLSARRWMEETPREPHVPPEELSRPPASSDMRIALVPAAGSSVEGNRFVTPIFGGLQRASRDFGLDLDVAETPEGEQPGDATLRLIAKGYNVIVAVSWRDPDMLWGIAREHPDARFIHFGGHQYPEPLPNLLGLAYRMDEAGFLAGALAGRATEGRRVAVIGGIPLPSVEELMSGFDRGVKQVCPECEVIVRFTDTFSDLSRGQELGRQVIEEGADVVFNAAGASGSAAIRSAAEQGAWVIGVDWDEYSTTFRGGQVPHADRLLGSVIVCAEDQAYETVEHLVRGDFEPGNVVLGVARGGIEFLPSPQSAHPHWPELEGSVQELTDRLRSGESNP
jgi:basic membrane lipoprotein Med (substrate-binding protein (PBP1-ABC) superfamily)